MAAKDTAVEILNKCNKLGWEVTIRGSIMKITKQIEPNNNDSFVTADMEYYSILSLLPSTSPGSIWGTDGGGVGAISAVKTGLFVMNKSGGSVRVLNALSKLIGGNNVKK